jgi:hypothetical protein
MLSLVHLISCHACLLCISRHCPFPWPPLPYLHVASPCLLIRPCLTSPLHFSSIYSSPTRLFSLMSSFCYCLARQVRIMGVLFSSRIFSLGILWLSLLCWAGSLSVLPPAFDTTTCCSTLTFMTSGSTPFRLWRYYYPGFTTASWAGSPWELPIGGLLSGSVPLHLVY